MYGAMLYSYFYDNTHISFMKNMHRLSELVCFTILMGMFIPVLLLKFIGGEEANYNRFIFKFSPRSDKYDSMPEG